MAEVAILIHRTDGLVIKKFGSTNRHQNVSPPTNPWVPNTSLHNQGMTRQGRGGRAELKPYDAIVQKLDWHCVILCRGFHFPIR